MQAWILTRWQDSNECRQTKLWFPMGPRPEDTKALLQKSRIELGISIQFLSGHSWLRRHCWIVDSNYGQRPSTFDPLCWLCGLGEETPVHLWTCIQKLDKNLPKTKSWSSSALDRFLGTKSMVLLLEKSQEEQIVEVYISRWVGKVV